MSQQMKMTAFAVCLSAALVALVAGQGVDMNGCSQKAQKAVKEYNQGMSKAVGEMMSQLGKHGQDTANVDAITAQANEIMSSLSQAADTENLTDVGKLSKIGQQTLDAYIKMGSLVFRSESITNAISIYSNFAGKALPMYTTFINNMISACGPTRGATN